MEPDLDDPKDGRPRRWGVVAIFVAACLGTLILRFVLQLHPDHRFWFTVAAFVVNLLMCVASMALLTGGRRPRSEFGVSALCSTVVLLWFLTRLLKYAYVLN